MPVYQWDAAAGETKDQATEQKTCRRQDTEYKKQTILVLPSSTPTLQESCTCESTATEMPQSCERYGGREGNTPVSKAT